MNPPPIKVIVGRRNARSMSDKLLVCRGWVGRPLNSFQVSCRSDRDKLKFVGHLASPDLRLSSTLYQRITASASQSTPSPAKLEAGRVPFIVHNERNGDRGGEFAVRNPAFRPMRLS